MDRSLYLLVLLLFEAGKLYKNILVLCYDEERMHEAIERASHEKYTEEKMLVSVIEYIAGHKFFAYDPRNRKVGLHCALTHGIHRSLDCIISLPIILPLYCLF